MRVVLLLPLVLVVSPVWSKLSWPSHRGRQCVEWITSCRPSECDPESSVLLERAQSVGRVTNRAIVIVRGGRQFVREHLARDDPRGCDVVVFGDATDVIPGTGTAANVRAVLRRLTRGKKDRLVVSTDPACWVGRPCSQDEATRFVRAMYDSSKTNNTNRKKGRRKRRPATREATWRYLFAAAGQYAGSRDSVAAFVDFALSLDAGCDDQCAVVNYSISFPERVILDRRGELFASLRRWYVVDGENRTATNTARDPKCAAAPPSTLSPAAASSWFHPPCDDDVFDQALSRFALGNGRHCNATRAAAHALKWCPSKVLPNELDLVYDAAGTPVAPLLGWHGNADVANLLLDALAAQPSRPPVTPRLSATDILLERRTLVTVRDDDVGDDGPRRMHDGDDDDGPRRKHDYSSGSALYRWWKSHQRRRRPEPLPATATKQ